MEMVTQADVKRGDVYLVDLNPIRGVEIQKMRPCVIVSPDELNTHFRSFIVAPLTSGQHDYPFRVPCRFQDKSGYIVLDQIRTVDRGRLVRRLGKLQGKVVKKSMAVLQEMFTY